MAAVFAFHAGEAIVQISTIEIPVNDLLEIGSPEPTSVTPKAPARKKNLIIALVSLAVIGLGAYGYTAGWHKQASTKASSLLATKSVGGEESLSKARTAFSSGDINAAIEAYKAAIAASPSDIAARGELGNVYYTAGMMA
jgi:hypothetical protein